MRFELMTTRLSVEHSNAQHSPYSHKVVDLQAKLRGHLEISKNTEWFKYILVCLLKD